MTLASSLTRSPPPKALPRVDSDLLRQALDASTIVVVTDARGVIIDCNRKFVDVSGYSRDELLGSTHRLVNSGTHDTAFFADLYRTIRSGQIWRGTICNRRKDGSLYWVDTTILPSMGADNRPQAFIAIRFEVTDHILALQQLAIAHDAAEQAMLLRDRFLANMSHEVRTPLNGILGLTSALMRADLAGAEREKVELIHKSGDALRRIVDDVLDLSKLQSGAMRLVEPDFLPSDLVRAAELMRAMAEAKALRFTVRADPRLPQHLRGDAVRLGQIIANLTSNAVKFTSSGEVRVDIAVRGPAAARRLKVRVVDSGPGFDRAAGARLFNPFVQVDDSHTKACGGTGLGLSISRELAEIMGGSLQARSSPGRGSMFVLTVPLQTATGDAPAPAACAPEAPDSALKILLVEDNLVNQKVAVAMLEPFDVGIDIANDGAEAVGAWRPETYDVVLMDMQMPVMDGLAATRRMRALESESGATPTRIIMLTANASDHHRQQALTAGADHVLAKPYTASDLITALSKPD